MAWGRKWPKYVSVAELKEQSASKIAKLRKQGKSIDPVGIEGAIICTSFWAKAWCDHLQTYADAAYRLERGRKYVRCGCVVDLKISAAKVRARVGGSRVYTVGMDIEALPKKRRAGITQACRNEIASFVDLLAGEISTDVMTVVTDPELGLFPSLKELSMSCTCPDGDAYLCKHIAAALYGIAVRIDADPGLLFQLRGIDPLVLFELPVQSTGPYSMDALKGDGELDVSDLSSVFGVEIAKTTQSEV